jgi:glycerol-3-phosphate dehydrogenase (NAD(P)+)
VSEKSASAFQRAGVIGAGAWGTTLAWLLGTKGFPVTLWAYEPEVVDSINQNRTNQLYLPNISLPTTIRATGSVKEAVTGADIVVMVTPSHVLRTVATQVQASLSAGASLVVATKGIEEETLLLTTQVLEAVMTPACRRRLAVLSGPSFAVEVCQGHPTAVVLAGEEAALVKRLQEVFLTPQFRVYAGEDVVGVQLGGALKNVIALATGVVEGLGLGHNTRAALITRGLAEMVRLGQAMGAVPQTFYGLSGVGDLVLTCTGAQSRNRSVGVRLGEGASLEAILKETRTVAEGVRTAAAACGLARRFEIEMPIMREVSAVLFEGKAPREAVRQLMERAAREETTK